MRPEEKAYGTRTVLMDVDGTLTDGTILVMPDGEEVKAFNTRDGLGILPARLAGLQIGLITDMTSMPVTRRAEKPGVAEVRQSLLDKNRVHEIRNFDSMTESGRRERRM